MKDYVHFGGEFEHIYNVFQSLAKCDFSYEDKSINENRQWNALNFRLSLCILKSFCKSLPRYGWWLNTMLILILKPKILMAEINCIKQYANQKDETFICR